jgi:tetratricopeptide (TPR) repeat protein
MTQLFLAQFFTPPIKRSGSYSQSHYKNSFVNKAKFLGLMSLLAVSASCVATSSLKDVQNKVSELEEQKQFEEARAVYKKHQVYRLSRRERAEWENPYFYSLLIGDLYLKEGKATDSLTMYEEALRHKVEAHLIDDRILKLGVWYMEKGLYGEAISLLSKYQKRNPLLYESALDKASKELTKRETQ